MKKLFAVLALTIAPLAALADHERAAVDVVFCIDRSGSMSGVIQTAKEKVWAIVNDIARIRPTPVLRIGLIGYGSADTEFKSFPLTDDLDAVYGNLMTFQTDMGGDEWVGAVVGKATNEMGWSTDKDALRIIFVVGNETAMQGTPDNMYTVTVPRAIAKDIVVNAIYCGGPGPDEERTWREVAKLADGAYTVIDESGGAITIETPMDQELAELNGKLNGTYLPFGAAGAEGQANQVMQDANSHANGAASNMAQRAMAKSWDGYNCARWDLVDACAQEGFKLEEVKDEALPEEMRKMSTDERRAHIAAKKSERDALMKRINELGRSRQDFIDAKVKAEGLTQDKAFDEAVRKAVREQAARRGMAFGEEK
ncbi:MAG: vWA domain-containing protein [Planctomycetota bacterium]